MRIFITGASGFIGGAIATALASEHEILAMSRSDKSDIRLKEIGRSPFAVISPVSKLARFPTAMPSSIALPTSKAGARAR